MQITFPRGPLVRRKQHLQISGEQIVLGLPGKKGMISDQNEPVEQNQKL
jgi:hypothetical protein